MRYYQSMSKTEEQASRAGKKQITGFFEPEAQTLMKQIALDENSSVQELLREAINDLFVKRGKKPIA